jgi:muconolactone delta-isomerase
MHFLVISTPLPAPPESVKAARLQFRSWMRELKAKGKVVHYAPRVGRGSVVILDAATNDELHNLLHRWLNIVPVSFDIYPLIDALDDEGLAT